MTTEAKKCVCYEKDGSMVRVLLCPIHGDTKARGGKQSMDRVPASSLRTKTPMKAASDKVENANAYLQGIKDMIIWAMISEGAEAWCQRCEKDSGARTLEDARKKLDLHHHDQKRSEGPRYNHQTKVPGVDHPSGLLLICRRCHKELEAR